MPTPSETPFTCLVLDDDFMALELVASFVEQIPSLVLGGTFEQPLAAFEHLARQPADLLITDIEMPGLSGLELVRALRQPPLVVFMTAHTHYAAGTYDLDAVDYLVKPLRFDRFLRAVDKALPLLRLRRAAEVPAAPPATATNDDFFFVRTELQYVKVACARVAYLEAMRDFTKIHLLDGTVHITLVNLKNMEDQLPAGWFVRTHRSFLVNAAEIEALSGHEVQLRGVPAQRLPLGGTFREAVTAQVVQRLISRRPERP